MAEPRKVNSNVENLKALGKRFGGAEGRKQDQFDTQTKEAPSEIPNVITGPIETIKVKPLSDKELDEQRKNQEVATEKVET